MYASVSAKLALPALKRGLLPLVTASDLSWIWLQDEAWVESKTEQEALLAAYSALPDIAKAVLSFEAFTAKASAEQIAAGLRVAGQQGAQQAGMVLPSQVACLRLYPSLDSIDWAGGQIAMSVSPKWLRLVSSSDIAPVSYSSGGDTSVKDASAAAKKLPVHGKFVGWQQMPASFSAQQEVRWLAPQEACFSYNQRSWLKLSKQALSQLFCLHNTALAAELTQLVRTDQRYRQVKLHQVQFDIESFRYQVL